MPSRSASSWIQAVAGLIAAGAAANMFCTLPSSHGLTGMMVLSLAVKYVFITLFAGIVQVWAWRVLFRRQYDFSSSTLILYSGMAWLLVAPVTVLSQRGSLLMAALMIFGAALLVLGLRTMNPAALDATPAYNHDIFSGPLPAAPWPWLAFGLSICIYAGLMGLHTQFLFDAGLLLAGCTAVFLWRFTSTRSMDDKQKKWSPSVLQMISALIVAILLTAWTLLPWVGRVNYGVAAAAVHPHKVGAAPPDNSAAYKGIILWTVDPKKKQEFIAPRPEIFQPSAKSKPLIIPFDGAYWYYQLPATGPGAKAHHAYGTPVAVNIHSNDLLPLLMEAHQDLGNSIDLACCRDVEVAVQNGDNRAGAIQLGLLLTDTTLPGKPSQYLGVQTVISSLPQHFSLKNSPAAETLRFPVPEQTKIRRFNAITVIYMPDSQRSVIGAKVAIEHFALIPR